MTDKKRIFYCNITYGCNSDCVFCYSHNTRKNSFHHNEIDVNAFIDYLEYNSIHEFDRVIVNGGEPLLHSNIHEFLVKLNAIGCEVLIYTNGRLLSELDSELLLGHCRFVIPIHGHRELHDKITRVPNSYNETIEGLFYLSRLNTGCKIDIKIIINIDMVNDYEQFQQTLASLEHVHLNNAVHITKMADTLVSKQNNCVSVNNEIAAVYTRELFEYYKNHFRVKIFDTCIKGIRQYIPNDIEKHCTPISVHFKDLNQEFDLDLKKNKLVCAGSCDLAEICQSAVDEYTVLDFNGHDVYINLE